MKQVSGFMDTPKKLHDRSVRKCWLGNKETPTPATKLNSVTNLIFAPAPGCEFCLYIVTGTCLGTRKKKSDSGEKKKADSLKSHPCQ